MMQTTHLRYSDYTGLVSLRSPDGGDDIPVGYVEDVELCPDRYLAEWEWLLQEVRDAMAFAEGCRAAADTAHRARFDPRGW